MEPYALILLSIGLAMDAFAVSICKGMSTEHPKWGSVVIVGLWFGGFQALMPVIGYFLGEAVYDTIADYDHWVAFILLALIGANMIREAVWGGEEKLDDDLSVLTMLVLAIATSIDAFAVGISLAMDGSGIFVPAAVIGTITFVLSAIGMRFGTLLGSRYGRFAEFVGGTILIMLGLKILAEHTGFL